LSGGNAEVAYFAGGKHYFTLLKIKKKAQNYGLFLLFLNRSSHQTMSLCVLFLCTEIIRRGKEK
jgi:hypothetical protein